MYSSIHLCGSRYLDEISINRNRLSFRIKDFCSKYDSTIFEFSFQTDLTASGLANYKRRPSVTNTKYPTPVVPNIPYNNSIKPVPQKRGPETGNSSSNSSSKSRQNTSGQRESKSGNSDKQKSQNKPKLPELKPTFSTFKQFNRTASLSDLINENMKEYN